MDEVVRENEFPSYMILFYILKFFLFLDIFLNNRTIMLSPKFFYQTRCTFNFINALQNQYKYSRKYFDSLAFLVESFVWTPKIRLHNTNIGIIENKSIWLLRLYWWGCSELGPPIPFPFFWALFETNN